MTLAAHFAAMARNNAWSNARLHTACERLSDDAFAARRVSFFPSLRETLNHILIVDRYYLDALQGGGLGRATLRDEIPYPNARDLWPAQRAQDERLIAFCDSLEEPSLMRVIAIDRDGGAIDHEAVGDVLAHLFVHQLHHRGQAHAMLSGTELVPPQLDEFFLAADRPARDAELRSLGLTG